MSGATIPIGIKGGLPFRPHEVANGLSCGCVCPACAHPLIAANQGSKVDPYFRHDADSDCVRGYQRGVLLAAKLALSDIQTFELPGYTESVTARFHGLPILENIAIAPKRIFVDSILLNDNGDADATLCSGGHELNVVFAIRGRSTDSQTRRLQNQERPSLLIDLSRLTVSHVLDTEAFNRSVVGDLALRRWIFSRIVQRARDTAQLKIDAKIEEFRQWAANPSSNGGVNAARPRSMSDADLCQQAGCSSVTTQVRPVPKRLSPAIQGADRKHAIKLRIEQIVSSYAEVLHHHNGEGLLCGRCWFLNPAGHPSCRWCSAADDMRPIRVDEPLLATIRPRLNCNTRPDESLATLPVALRDLP